MRQTLVRAGVAVAALAMTGAVVAGSPATANEGRRHHGGRPFRLALRGSAEVPTNTHGDADHGSVVLTLNQGQEKICFTFGALTLSAGEALPTDSHIHRAPAGAAGPVVVPLFSAATAPTSYPTARSCVSAGKDLIKEIRQHPRRFYVNLHNATHPSGVVRSQLHK